jgi:allantoin racemase
MRIWYQSLTRPDAWPAYNAALRAVLDRAKDADTTVEVHGIEARGGIGDQYRYLEFIEAQEVLSNVERATREGYDAFLIGNIGDPGLREAREIATMPVLGLCETSTHLACMMGANFALVTGNAKHAPRIIENVNKYGLASRLAGVRMLTVDRLVDLDLGFSDERAGRALVDQFLSAARAHAGAGAEVIIPAVGVLMTLLATHGVHEAEPGIPILNGVTTLLKMGEAAVRMRRAMGGVWTSRRAMYAMPPAAQLEELRAHYGPVYPAAPQP